MAHLASLAVLLCILKGLLAQEGNVAEDILALTADDACTDPESCSVELVQLRGKKGDEQDNVEEEYNKDEAEGNYSKRSTKDECLNHKDMAKWKSAGAKSFHTDLTQCGLRCNGVDKCATACMENKGYTTPCADCMGDLGWCAMKSCSAHCINKGCQSQYARCFDGTETEKGKCTTYWMQHNCVAEKHERVYTFTNECVSCMHGPICGATFEKCSGLKLAATIHKKHKHVFRWWLNKK